MEEHTHHNWQTNEVPRPSTDQLFNDIFWWAKDQGFTPTPTLINTQIWMGKIAEKLHKPPFNTQELMDTIGTTMIGLIGLATSLDLNPNGCLDIAMNTEAFPKLPKTYKTLNPVSPVPNKEPQWMKKLRAELEAKFVGMFVHYPEEDSWVRLERVDIDYRNNPEGRQMDRVQDIYGNMWFVTELTKELGKTVKPFYECPSNKVVYGL